MLLAGFRVADRCEEQELLVKKRITLIHAVTIAMPSASSRWPRSPIEGVKDTQR